MTRIVAAIVALMSATGVAHAQDAPPDAPSPEETAQAAEQMPQSDPGALQRLLAIVHNEPNIRQVQQSALSHYELEPDRVSGIITAAHLKGLIPEIEASYDLNLGSHFQNMRDGLYPILPDLPTNPNPNAFKERVTGESTQNTFRVRAVFNLDRLVFNAEALDARSLNSLGEQLVREITTLFYARRRLLATLLLTPPQSDAEMFYELMRLDELTATIDALTGGRFARRAWQWEDELLGGNGG